MATVTAPPPHHWRWFDFWSDLVRCGSRAMPAVFILPTDDVAMELEKGNGTVSRLAMRAKLFAMRGALFEQGRSEKRSRKQAERERYVEGLRSVRKSVLVPLSQTAGNDLYCVVSSEELDASMRAMLTDDPGPTSEEDGGSHVSVSAVPFDSLAP